MKSFEEFINEKILSFHDEGGVKISSKKAFPFKMIKEIVNKLKSLDLISDGKKLVITNSDTDETYGIFLSTGHVSTHGNFNFMAFYKWDGHLELWTGGYDKSIKMENGEWALSDSNEPMSLEEFINCLWTDHILSDHDRSVMLDFMNKLRIKYRGAISGVKYNI